jgi:hypothetical protein
MTDNQRLLLGEAGAKMALRNHFLRLMRANLEPNYFEMCIILIPGCPSSAPVCALEHLPPGEGYFILSHFPHLDKPPAPWYALINKINLQGRVRFPTGGKVREPLAEPV